MYEFRDINTASEGDILPSEALQINGDFIENIIPGYRTLNVSGREALTPELNSFETGNRDGSTLKNKRYPARTIIVKYQIIAKSNEEFREAYNRLADILNVEEAELIFNDEPDKFFRGTPSAMGDVTPGRNAVVGEFELFCADPFKYSVVEYEAEPEISTGSFLIDYNGTYKAYPTLEAEFHRESESIAALTGNGDCGYVAFFNENEKIIQLGDPDETDTETYDKSQTLVNQNFTSETAWNTIAQANWATNRGKISSADFPQVGSVAIKAGSQLITTAPSTEGQLIKISSRAATPNIDYVVTAKTSNRTATTIDVAVTIKSSIAGTSSSGSVKIAAGAAVSLNKTRLFASSTSSSAAATKTGTYYIWSDSVVSGRVRITNSKSYVGKSGKVTGWVNVSDIGATASGYSSLGTGYGLRGSIKFGGGDWYNVTIKGENATWGSNKSYSASTTVKVRNLSADTAIIEEIKFKVTRTDNNDSKVGIIEETYCNDFEISTYTAPVADSWYLAADTYGTGNNWHGPSITRTIPADASGHIGASNFTFSYRQKMAIGYSSTATQEMGEFQALVISGSGTNRRMLAAVNIFKGSVGTAAKLRFYVNNKIMETIDIDLSTNNKYMGNDSAAKGIIAVKTSTITKTGKKVEFNIGGIKRTFSDDAIQDVEAKEITFYFPMHSTKPALSYNGLYGAKFIKNNSDTWADIPNKFSANDIVTADCKNGEILLNNSPLPALGALGNDWEEFYLSPGLNQIGFAYSDWVSSQFAPKFKIRYREVFI